jgi:hypothetical protein
MKPIYFLFFAFFFSQCASLENYPSEIKLINIPDVSKCVVSGNGYAKNTDQAINEAEKNIFNVILFLGIAGTDLERPLIENSAEAKNTHNSYFKSLLENNGYKKFIMERGPTSTNIVKGGFQGQTTLTINLIALRKDLEDNGIIRKFGF